MIEFSKFSLELVDGRNDIPPTSREKIEKENDTMSLLRKKLAYSSYRKINLQKEIGVLKDLKGCMARKRQAEREAVEEEKKRKLRARQLVLVAHHVDVIECQDIAVVTPTNSLSTDCETKLTIYDEKENSAIKKEKKRTVFFPECRPEQPITIDYENHESMSMQRTISKKKRKLNNSKIVISIPGSPTSVTSYLFDNNRKNTAKNTYEATSEEVCNENDDVNGIMGVPHLISDYTGDDAQGIFDTVDTLKVELTEIKKKHAEEIQCIKTEHEEAIFRKQKQIESLMAQNVTLSKSAHVDQQASRAVVSLNKELEAEVARLHAANNNLIKPLQEKIVKGTKVIHDLKQALSDVTIELDEEKLANEKLRATNVTSADAADPVEIEPNALKESNVGEYWNWDDFDSIESKDLVNESDELVNGSLRDIHDILHSSSTDPPELAGLKISLEEQTCKNKDLEQVIKSLEQGGQEQHKELEDVEQVLEEQMCVNTLLDQQLKDLEQQFEDLQKKSVGSGANNECDITLHLLPDLTLMKNNLEEQTLFVQSMGREVEQFRCARKKDFETLLASTCPVEERQLFLSPAKSQDDNTRSDNRCPQIISVTSCHDSSTYSAGNCTLRDLALSSFGLSDSNTASSSHNRNATLSVFSESERFCYSSKPSSGLSSELEKDLKMPTTNDIDYAVASNNWKVVNLERIVNVALIRYFELEGMQQSSLVTENNFKLHTVEEFGNPLTFFYTTLTVRGQKWDPTVDSSCTTRVASGDSCSLSSNNKALYGNRAFQHDCGGLVGQRMGKVVYRTSESSRDALLFYVLREIDPKGVWLEDIMTEKEEVCLLRKHTAKRKTRWVALIRKCGRIYLVDVKDVSCYRKPTLLYDYSVSEARKTFQGAFKRISAMNAWKRAIA